MWPGELYEFVDSPLTRTRSSIVLEFLSESPFFPPPADPHLIMARKPVWDDIRFCQEQLYQAFIVLFLSLHPFCLSKCNGAGEEDGWHNA